MDIERLRREFPARRIDYYPAVDSTMRAAAGLEPGAVVLAERADRRPGPPRPRRGTPSRQRHLLLASCSSPRPSSRWRWASLPPTPSRSATGMACDLRWPNDVMLGGQEGGRHPGAVADGKAIAGIGINVNHTRVPGGTGDRSHLAAPARRRAGSRRTEHPLGPAARHRSPSWNSTRRPSCGCSPTLPATPPAGA